jgi:hypothetical protein
MKIPTISWAFLKLEAWRLRALGAAIITNN